MPDHGRRALRPERLSAAGLGAGPDSARSGAALRQAGQRGAVGRLTSRQKAFQLKQTGPTMLAFFISDLEFPAGRA